MLPHTTHNTTTMLGQYLSCGYINSAYCVNVDCPSLLAIQLNNPINTLKITYCYLIIVGIYVLRVQLIVLMEHMGFS